MWSDKKKVTLLIWANLAFSQPHSSHLLFLNCRENTAMNIIKGQKLNPALLLDHKNWSWFCPNHPFPKNCHLKEKGREQAQSNYLDIFNLEFKKWKPKCWQESYMKDWKTFSFIHIRHSINAFLYTHKFRRTFFWNWEIRPLDFLIVPLPPYHPTHNLGINILPVLPMLI